MERTLLMVKPDGMKRGLAPKIFEHVEKAGLNIAAKKELTLSRELAEKFYAVHRGKEFFGPLVNLITSGPVSAAWIEGDSAVQKIRDLIGPTLPSKAPKGTIRGDFKGERERGEGGVIENVVHASDSPENGKYEIGLIFGKDPL